MCFEYITNTLSFFKVFINRLRNILECAKIAGKWSVVCSKRKEGSFLIQLKNVSKFYYSKGMIASGFSRVNLDFHVGEFVVITGESGSGKSTLLNVISGLDSYEEGELYIEGKETSHYLASDFEEYRKKYIGNIFQHFNLVGSYTTYQNVALILRINGYKKAEIKKKVPAILERVGLSKYSRTKVSKLSGGQKQRVSIARALAKDTAIVVADEPTGNLDSESAKGIAQLLKEISRDKLVIVVTHNYDQFAPYATRKIKMHDGKVVEDETLRPVQKVEKPQDGTVPVGKLSVASKIRLGLRNTFNILPKFLLLLIVFLFVVLAVTSEYTTLKNSKEEAAKTGYNDYFINYSEDRLVLKKEDQTSFTNQDYETLQHTAGVRQVIKEDVLLDNAIYLEGDEVAYSGYPLNLENFRGKLEHGRMPEKSNEVILTGDKNDYYFQPENIDRLWNQTYTITMDTGITQKIRITGIAFEEQSDNPYYFSEGNIYLSKVLMEKILRENYRTASQVTATVNGNALVSSPEDQSYSPMISDNVETGKALVSEELNGYYNSGRATGNVISLKVENLFYKRSVDVTVSDTYNEKNFKDKTGLEGFEEKNGAIFVSKEDYRRLFRKANFQATVYVSDVKELDTVKTALKEKGYLPLSLVDTLFGMDGEMTSIIQVPMAVIMLIAVFFIAYFVIQLILRSRSSYFSILRMLGLEKRSIRRVMDIELFTVTAIAYGLFLGVVALVRYDVIQADFLQPLVDHLKILIEYLHVTDYIILYAVLIFMAYLISGKFARKLFKKTAMGSYREEE